MTLDKEAPNFWTQVHRNRRQFMLLTAAIILGCSGSEDHEAKLADLYLRDFENTIRKHLKPAVFNSTDFPDWDKSILEQAKKPASGDPRFRTPHYQENEAYTFELKLPAGQTPWKINWVGHYEKDDSLSRYYLSVNLNAYPQFGKYFITIKGRKILHPHYLALLSSYVFNLPSSINLQFEEHWDGQLKRDATNASNKMQLTDGSDLNLRIRDNGYFHIVVTKPNFTPSF